MKIIKPDIAFINEINRDTGFSLKSCMQCGTCSVVCDLSPKNKPFPRKEMFWASWGLKEKLMGDPDIWLCHQCGDCTTYCPRGVKPGDVLSSIRKICYYHYAKPKFLGTILKKPAYLPFVFAVPVLFLLLVLFFAGTYIIPEGDINYSTFLPHKYLNTSFSVLLLFVLWGVILSVRSFWNALDKHSSGIDKKSNLFKISISVIKEILIHENFKKCTTQKFRYPAHFLIFWGFMLLILTTILAIVNVLFFEYPFSIWHPFKVLGNIAGIMFLAGCCLVIFQRITNRKNNSIYTYTDWMFLISILIISISGFLTEFARLGNWRLAYHIYFFHLIFTWILIIYLPYTKFSHIIYRTLATIHARYTGR
ncbi:MAG: quinone-interacting membrane-bound oxidoreductase complex subunit QmoC [Bacteroidales bacterium]|nr:quinone-interacting membrane-bound oxidoreductase complex subunit QmoC [Bacteroidales bacterium]